MTSWKILRRQAMRSALQLRRSLAIAREDCINSFDVAASIGVDLRFVDAPSLEGMFARDPHPIIILPSLKHRPRGRVIFSCAHEIGHFQLGHPPTVDERLDEEVVPRPKSDDEVAADAFAASLLMPRPAVMHRFKLKTVLPHEASPLQVYQVATELGVGYGALLTHMRFALELVSDDFHRQMKRVTPKQLRTEVAGISTRSSLTIVDEGWPGTPIDLEVADVVALPIRATFAIGAPLAEQSTNQSWRLLVADAQGEGTLNVAGSSLVVRVARQGYCGSFKYRYLADPDAA